jgi:hypothetical protein
MLMFLGILCFLLSLVMLIISINPKWIARGKTPLKRKHTLLTALVMFALFFTFALNDADNPTSTPTAAKVADTELKAKQEAEAKAEAAKITDADKALLIKSQYKLFTEDEVKQFTEIEKKYTASPDPAIKADYERLSAQKQYQAWIKAQFSVWDGSNTHLVDLLKKNLNDPKSFDHEETTYKDMGDHLIIKMTYRAKNAFGALILQNVTAKADYKTQTISVISQNN